MVGSGRQQFRLSTRIRMGWRWRRRLLVSQKGEKEEEVSTPLTPDPSAVFSRYFPYHHPKADISKPTFLRPLPQRHILLLPMHFLRGGMLLFSPFLFLPPPPPLRSLQTSASSLTLFLRDSEKKRRGRQGVLQFFRLPSVLTLYVGSPLFRAINSVRHKLSSRLVNSLLLLPPPPTGSLLLHGEREKTETWMGGGKQ